MKTFVFTYRHVPLSYSPQQLMEVEAPTREEAVKYFLNLWLAPMPEWKVCEKMSGRNDAAVAGRPLQSL